jgi:hypothetical protein
VCSARVVREDLPKAVEYFRLSSDSYGRSLGTGHRRCVDAARRAKALSDRIIVRTTTPSDGRAGTRGARRDGTRAPA